MTTTKIHLPKKKIHFPQNTITVSNTTEYKMPTVASCQNQAGCLSRQELIIHSYMNCLNYVSICCGKSPTTEKKQFFLSTAGYFSCSSCSSKGSADMCICTSSRPAHHSEASDLSNLFVNYTQFLVA